MVYKVKKNNILKLRTTSLPSYITFDDYVGVDNKYTDITLDETKGIFAKIWDWLKNLFKKIKEFLFGSTEKKTNNINNAVDAICKEIGNIVANAVQQADKVTTANREQMVNKAVAQHSLKNTANQQSTTASSTTTTTPTTTATNTTNTTATSTNVDNKPEEKQDTTTAPATNTNTNTNTTTTETKTENTTQAKPQEDPKKEELTNKLKEVTKKEANNIKATKDKINKANNKINNINLDKVDSNKNIEADRQKYVANFSKAVGKLMQEGGNALTSTITSMEMAVTGIKDNNLDSILGYNLVEIDRITDAYDRLIKGYCNNPDILVGIVDIIEIMLEDIDKVLVITKEQGKVGDYFVHDGEKAPMLEMLKNNVGKYAELFRTTGALYTMVKDYVKQIKPEWHFCAQDINIDEYINKDKNSYLYIAIPVAINGFGTTDKVNSNSSTIKAEPSKGVGNATILMEYRLMVICYNIEKDKGVYGINIYAGKITEEQNGTFTFDTEAFNEDGTLKSNNTQQETNNGGK